MVNACVGRLTCNAGARMLRLGANVLVDFICVQNRAACSRTAFRTIIRRVEVEARGPLSRGQVVSKCRLWVVPPNVCHDSA